MRGMLHCFVAAIPPSPRPTARPVDQGRHTAARHSPTTIIVKCAPRLATILYLCNPDTRVQLRGAWQETTTGKAHLVGEVGNADTVGEGGSSGHGERRAKGQRGERGEEGGERETRRRRTTKIQARRPLPCLPLFAPATERALPCLPGAFDSCFDCERARRDLRASELACPLKRSMASSCQFMPAMPTEHNNPSLSHGIPISHWTIFLAGVRLLSCQHQSKTGRTMWTAYMDDVLL